MTIIARRLKAAREAAELTQRQLSDQLGFKDRQTVAAIEAGNRKVSAEELIKIMKILDRDLEYFTDPYRLDGEGTFSWRSASGADQVMNDFELRAGRWLALYRSLVQDEEGNAPGTSPLGLNLTARSSYEDAHRAADWLAGEWQLGNQPALKLEDAIRNRLRALVLHVDAPQGISGAAFQLPEFNAILVNRTEPEGRRNFHLAHELFHLLTWETIRPAHTETGMRNPKGRPEQLANCFASSLLMPERIIRERLVGDNDTTIHEEPRRGTHDWATTFHAHISDGHETPLRHPHPRMNNKSVWRSWLNDNAWELRVSTPALQWRMVQLGLMTKDHVDNELDWFNERGKAVSPPAHFSADFVRALHNGLAAGKLSVRLSLIH